MKKVALITGITGQDGAYLAKLLLSKGYEVHGLVRYTSTANTERLHSLLSDEERSHLHMHYGDLRDGGALIRIVDLIVPDEIYNLAAQSHVAVSFETPEFTADVNGLGTLRLLEVIRVLGLKEKTRFYQASTSELFGKVQEFPQKETTPFYPRSPYAVAKLFAYWTVINYREAYGLYAANGILFNHESPLRGAHFVTRKATLALANIFVGAQDCLFMGNLSSKRDWGHARDYVEMQWLMLQQQKAEDFVIATGEQHTVREFIECAALELGIELAWQGDGVEEVGIVTKIHDQNAAVREGQIIVAVDPRFFRPTEVDTLLGDMNKAFSKLGWKPKTTFAELAAEMMREDLKAVRAKFAEAVS